MKAMNQVAGPHRATVASAHPTRVDSIELSQRHMRRLRHTASRSTRMPGRGQSPTRGQKTGIRLSPESSPTGWRPPPAAIQVQPLAEPVSASGASSAPDAQRGSGAKSEGWGTDQAQRRTRGSPSLNAVRIKTGQREGNLRWSCGCPRDSQNAPIWRIIGDRTDER